VALAAGFGLEDLSFIEAEVVGDFVPDGFAKEAAEGGEGAGGALVGTLVDGDAGGGLEGGGGGGFGGGAAFEEAEEFFAGGFGFDDEDEVVEAGAEAGRNDVHAGFDEAVEFGGGESHG
jgi:hypothetical protein